MVPVFFLATPTQTEYDNDITEQIGYGVYAISDERLAATDEPDPDLEDDQQDVHGDAQPGDAQSLAHIGIERMSRKIVA
jgi:hypothetical protein